MRRTLGPLLALCLGAAPATAEELTTRFEAGVRAGIGLPVGNAFGSTSSAPTGTSLSQLVSWTVPLQLDIGARIGPVFVGGYAGYAFGKTGSLLEFATTRSATDVRVGFEVLWHLGPEAKVDPWLGVGVGYEWLTLSVGGANGGGAVSTTTRGFEWANVQLGLDFVLGRNFRLGPFVVSHVAQYDSGSFGVENGQGGAVSQSGDVQSKAVHAWIDLGLRFSFLL